jgi:hypothetical protein
LFLLSRRKTEFFSDDSLTDLEAEMKYCGIDLHSNNSLVSVVDEEENVVAKKRPRTFGAALLIPAHTHCLCGMAFFVVRQAVCLLDTHRKPMGIVGLWPTPNSSGASGWPFIARTS